MPGWEQEGLECGCSHVALPELHWAEAGSHKGLHSIFPTPRKLTSFPAILVLLQVGDMISKAFPTTETSVLIISLSASMLSGRFSLPWAFAACVTDEC